MHVLVFIGNLMLIEIKLIRLHYKSDNVTATAMQSNQDVGGGLMRCKNCEKKLRIRLTLDFLTLASLNLLTNTKNNANNKII